MMNRKNNVIEIILNHSTILFIIFVIVLYAYVIVCLNISILADK